MTAQRFAVRPSDLLDIADKTDALDFDFACNLRMLNYENEKEFGRLKIYKIQFKNALSEWWNNQPDSLETIGNPAADDDDENAI